MFRIYASVRRRTTGRPRQGASAAFEAEPLAGSGNQDRRFATGELLGRGARVLKHLAAARPHLVLAGEVGVGRGSAYLVGGYDEAVLECGAPRLRGEIEIGGADDADVLHGRRLGRRG